LSVWPTEWDELTPEERVRVVVDAITDGTTSMRGQLRGLAPDVIEEVERDQVAPLGSAYRSFLTLMGAGAGRFLRGSDVYRPGVLGLGTSARDLLLENRSPFVLTDVDRVFFMHQGYQFAFLRGVGPDPEVWFYSEGASPDETPRASAARFTDWLRRHAESETVAWARLVSYEAEQRKAVPRFTLSGRLPDGSIVDGI
jgi:hypothetical protein